MYLMEALSTLNLGLAKDDFRMPVFVSRALKVRRAPIITSSYFLWVFRRCIRCSGFLLKGLI